MERFLEAQNWLKELASEAQFFRNTAPPSLAVTEKILDALDRPDRDFYLRIIVGGTAGKGSVCRLVEDVLLRAGKKVATLSSPHIQVITERIRIGGKLISAEDFGTAILKMKEVSADFEEKPTYYEAIVCAGIWAAREAGCQILIGEIGLGGRLDSVNAVQGKRIAAVTFIGDDHLERFGGKEEHLAREKAGIFTEDSILNLSYEQKYCSILNSVIKSKVELIKGIPRKLNKKLARKICENVLQTSAFEMRKVPLPCRWEKVAPDVILDGAHSAPRFHFILPKIKKISGKKTGVFGLGRNHDPEIFKIISDEFEEIFWVKIPESRDSWAPEELREKMGRGIVCADSKTALAKARAFGGTVLVNSFLLGGEVRNLFFDPQKILEQQTEWPK
ncbi:MAG: hypothetical protein K9M51_02480 [Candidatus Gracilibacteria bacterium]|nr:hypothetical protein [Candidatus Gracilibacteria bacterium]